MTGRDIRTYLSDRLTLAGAVPDVAILDGVEAYFALLQRWSRTINLTGFDLDQPSEPAIERLLVEPLIAAHWIVAGGHLSAANPTMVDIGSGGGSPGIPFALAVGARHLTLVEARSKKSTFLREAARVVGLPAHVRAERFEVVAGDRALTSAFDILTVRAVRLEMRAIDQLSGLLAPGGQLAWFRAGHGECPPSTAVTPTAGKALDTSGLSQLMLFTRM